MMAVSSLFLSAQTFAQTSNDYCANPPANATRGGFTVDKARGCAPLTVTVTNTTGPENVQYIYEYKNGEPTNGVSQVTYTYTKPGKYRILQVGSTGGTGSVACQEIEVLDATPPDIRLTSCANGQVQLTIVDNAVAAQYDEFVVDWGDAGGLQTLPKTNLSGIIHTYTDSSPRVVAVSGRYRAVNCGGTTLLETRPGSPLTQPVITRLATSGSTVTLDVQAPAGQVVTVQKKNAAGVFETTPLTRTGSGTLQIPDVTAHPTCFKVVSQDACGRSVASEEVCSIGLEVTPRDQRNEVRWTPITVNPLEFRYYRLTRNGAELNSFDQVSAGSFNDTQGLECNVEYCYQVTAVAGKTEIVSDRKCTTAQSSNVPPPFRTVLVSVNSDNRVDLRALPPQALPATYMMLVYRNTGPGGSYAPTGEEVSRNIHQDGGVQPDRQSYCYQVVYQNACGVNSQPTPSACTVYLSAGSATSLSWTAGSPFSDEEVDHYVIEKMDETGLILSQEDVGKQTSYTPGRDDPAVDRYRYRVKAVSRSGLASYSNVYEFTIAPRVFVPDAFTPNDDAVNDRFELKGSVTFESIQMTVFNRWGEVIFRTDSRDGWDGTLDGRPALPGTYAYKIVMRTQDGRQTVKTGSVLLIR